MLVPPSKRSSMPYSEITRNPKLGILLLAGLCLIAPAVLSSEPAEAHYQPETIDHQKAHVRAAGNASATYSHLAKIIVLKNDMRAAPGNNDSAYQPVAPRLQSRIRKNSEFAAFVKLVRATSKRKYTAEELQKLYFSFKAWSYHNGTTDQ